MTLDPNETCLICGSSLEQIPNTSSYRCPTIFQAHKYLPVDSHYIISFFSFPHTHDKFGTREMEIGSYLVSKGFCDLLVCGNGLECFTNNITNVNALSLFNSLASIEAIQNYLIIQ